jgi:hypothetical protein
MTTDSARIDEYLDHRRIERPFVKALSPDRLTIDSLTGLPSVLHSSDFAYSPIVARTGII